MQSEKGFSLVEMMITLAISAIIIGAAFGSYTIISRNFEWQKDMKYISQSARNVIEMIQKDIRNAGFRFEANAAITDPVKIYDAGDCCDRIEIIYDETINKRVKIEYRLQQYSSDNSRFRLYKKKTDLSNNNTLEYDTPIADHIEVLKFSASRGECPTDGTPTVGCGVKGWFFPDNADHPNDDYENFPTRIAPHTLNRNILCYSSSKSFDGDMNTESTCDVRHGPRADWGVWSFSFNNPVSIEQVMLSTSAHQGCKLSFNRCVEYYVGPGLNEHYAVYPRSFQYDFSVYGLNYNNNQWSDIIGITSGQVKTQGEIPGLKTYSFSTGDQTINWVALRMSKPKGYHWMSGQPYIDTVSPLQLPEIKFYGEKFSNSLIPTEVEISLLLRSPNQHGNSQRQFTQTIDSFVADRTDSYLRDFYLSSASIRNIYYQSQ